MRDDQGLVTACGTVQSRWSACLILAARNHRRRAPLTSSYSSAFFLAPLSLNILLFLMFICAYCTLYVVHFRLSSPLNTTDHGGPNDTSVALGPPPCASYLARSSVRALCWYALGSRN